jgi:hypothetical protein
MNLFTSSHDLSEDLKNSEMIMEKVRDNIYAQHLYAAICNNEFQKIGDVFDALRDATWGISWRAAGRLVAEMRGIGENYMAFYCSGIPADWDIDINNFKLRDHKPEGFITKEILDDLRVLGWRPVTL